MKKIVFSTDSLTRGGKERQLSILASALIDKGFTINILSKRFDEKNNYLGEYGISESLVFFYQDFSSYKNLIKTSNPDLVVSWDIKSSLYNVILSKIYGYKFVNGSIRHGIRLKKLSHFFRSFIAWLSPYVMANSNAGLKANNFKEDKRRWVLHNGIEAKFKIRPGKGEREKLRMKLIPDYSKKQNLKVFISVANLMPYKDYLTVLKALKAIKKHYPFYYIILGDGPMRETIRQKIADYDLGANVIMVGKTEKVASYLAIADCMIHSARGEGLSNAILEGMFVGLPILATDVGGNREAVFPDSSKLFPYQDADKLTEHLESIDSLFQVFTPKDPAYQKHLKQFSIETMTNRFLQLIQPLIKQ